MKSFVLTVRPAMSALSLGGQSAPLPGADKATARDADGRLVIPATALRGALRIELERLVRGRDGDAAACSANRSGKADAAVLDHPCQCPVCRLFGEEFGATGTLRLEDAVWAGSSSDPAASTKVVRPRIAVSRSTGTVVDKHLGFVETGDLLGGAGEDHFFRASARLVPCGPGDSSLGEDEAHLRAACAALNALGGGRSRGFGWIECSLEAAGEPAPRSANATAAKVAALARAGAAILRFTAEAPLHLGLGRPIGFFQPTLRHAPGSTVRGAIAYALLESGLASAEDDAFQRLVVTGETSFGTARLLGEAPSETRRRCRPGGHVFDDLVGELVRREAARRGLALASRAGHVCLQPGCASTKLLPVARRPGVREPVVRVRTKNALNRRTGTAMDRKLYSMEVLEPRLVDRSGCDPQPLELSAAVRGLDAASAHLLATLDGREVWLGGKRSKGLGRCRLRVEPEPAAAGVLDTAATLQMAVDAAWSALARAVGEPLASFLPAGERLLAIVLEEPWGDLGSESGPCLLGPLGEVPPRGAGLRLVDAWVALSQEGRFGAVESRRYGAPADLAGERPPEPAVAPGSVFVYAVPAERFVAELDRWVATGHRGGGDQRDLGWGRFAVRGASLDD